MNPYIQQFKEELSKRQILHNGCNCTSVLEIIWECYAESNPVGDADIQRCDAALAPIFEKLPLEDATKLFLLTCELCTAYQHAAFLDGIRVGASITAEL